MVRAYAAKSSLLRIEQSFSFAVHKARQGSHDAFADGINASAFRHDLISCCPRRTICAKSTSGINRLFALTEWGFQR